MDYENQYINDLKRLGDKIRELREAKGYSQETLGFKADLHRNYISSLELAQKNPTYTTLIKLATALEVTIVELISAGDEDVENKG